MSDEQLAERIASSDYGDGWLNLEPQVREKIIRDWCVRLSMIRHVKAERARGHVVRSLCWLAAEGQATTDEQLAERIASRDYGDGWPNLERRVRETVVRAWCVRLRMIRHAGLAIVESEDGR